MVLAIPSMLFDYKVERIRELVPPTGLISTTGTVTGRVGDKECLLNSVHRALVL